MNSSTVQWVQQQLHVVLPNVFFDFAQQFNHPPDVQAINDISTIQINPELFVISQRERFQAEPRHDYYELQPHLRNKRFLDIGEDGCGNFYCMDGSDARSNQLWFWEHDPYNGFIQTNRSLSDYFDGSWRIERRENPFKTDWSQGSIICRTDHPERSMLAPITCDEWREAINETNLLKLDEYRQITNLFTKEKHEALAYPGRAIDRSKRTPVVLAWKSGRVELKHLEHASPEIHAWITQATESLNASLI